MYFFNTCNFLHISVNNYNEIVFHTMWKLVYMYSVLQCLIPCGMRTIYNELISINYFFVILILHINYTFLFWTVTDVLTIILTRHASFWLECLIVLSTITKQLSPSERIRTKRIIRLRNKYKIEKQFKKI